MPVMLAMVVSGVGSVTVQFSDRVSLSSCVRSSQALVGRLTSSLSLVLGLAPTPSAVLASPVSVL